MKTETELKQLLKEFGGKKSANIVEELTELSERELTKIIKLHNDAAPSGHSTNALRNKMYNEIFKRNGLGRVSGNHLSFKQAKFLESLAVLADKKKTIYDNDDLDRTDRLILQYMKAGHTQAEIETLLKGLDIKPNSLSIIEKRLKAIREKYNAKTNFHLAVILFGK